MLEWSALISVGPLAPHTQRAPPPAQNSIPGLLPDAFCSRTNPSVILREDDFYSEDTVRRARAALTRFDGLMMPQRGYMANAARFKAQELLRLAEGLEACGPAYSDVDTMRMAWLVGRMDRAMNLCWYERAA